jgi:hypothetical protein
MVIGSIGSRCSCECHHERRRCQLDPVMHSPFTANVLSGLLPSHKAVDEPSNDPERHGNDQSNRHRHGDHSRKPKTLVGSSDEQSENANREDQPANCPQLAQPSQSFMQGSHHLKSEQRPSFGMTDGVGYLYGFPLSVVKPCLCAIAPCIALTFNDRITVTCGHPWISRHRCIDQLRHVAYLQRLDPSHRVT